MLNWVLLSKTDFQHFLLGVSRFYRVSIGFEWIKNDNKNQSIFIASGDSHEEGQVDCGVLPFRVELNSTGRIFFSTFDFFFGTWRSFFRRRPQTAGHENGRCRHRPSKTQKESWKKTKKKNQNQTKQKKLGFNEQRQPESHRSEWVWMGCTSFYWVLLGFSGFEWVSASLNGFYWVLPSWTVSF